MSGFKDGGQVIVPVPLEFTDLNTKKHTCSDCCMVDSSSIYYKVPDSAES
jgi:hypothetical protein